MTKPLWKIHSWLGLIAGLGLLVIGLTGSLLVFRTELELFLNRDYVRIPESPPDRKPLDILVERVRQTLPNHEVTGWLIPGDPSLADLAYVTHRGELEPCIAFVNPRSGEIRGGRLRWNQTFTGWMLELHYSFFADHIGILVAGVMAVLLCLLGLTGFRIYRDFWTHFIRFRWRASARIFLSDLHKTVGIASAVFNLLLGFTGAYWNLPHAISHFLSGEAEQSFQNITYSKQISLAKLMATASRKIPGFRASYVALPFQDKTPITIYGAVSTNPFRSEYGSSVTFDPITGECTGVADIRQSGAWRQLTDVFYPLHFGSFGGLPIRILWCLVGLTPGALAVSGFLIWRKRTRGLDPTVSIGRTRRDRLQARSPGCRRLGRCAIRAG